VKRVVCGEFSDPVRLEVLEEPTPAPGPGEALVEVEAAAVSFVDGLIVNGPAVGSAVAASAAESYSTMVFRGHAAGLDRRG
jgi:NADPH:quinone reductase-like Zn-dependent oxidoreductase